MAFYYISSSSNYNLIAITNAWGLFLIIFLNGFGLVSVPRKLLNYKDKAKRIKYLEFQAAKINDELDYFTDKIKEYTCRLKAIKSKFNSNSISDFNFKVELMWNTIISTSEAFDEYEPSKEDISYAEKVTNESLIGFNYKLKKYCHEYDRANNKLTELYHEWRGLSSETDSKGFSIKPHLLYSLGVLAIVLSLIIILSEMTLFLS